MKKYYIFFIIFLLYSCGEANSYYKKSSRTFSHLEKDYKKKSPKKDQFLRSIEIDSDDESKIYEENPDFTDEE